MVEVLFVGKDGEFTERRPEKGLDNVVAIVTPEAFGVAVIRVGRGQRAIVVLPPGGEEEFDEITGPDEIDLAKVVALVARAEENWLEEEEGWL